MIDVYFNEDGDVISDTKAMPWIKQKLIHNKEKSISVGTSLMMDCIRLLFIKGEIEGVRVHIRDPENKVGLINDFGYSNVLLECPLYNVYESLLCDIIDARERGKS